MVEQEGDQAAPAGPDEDIVQLVAYQLNNEWFATDVQAVSEVIPLTKLTQVPHTPDYVLGIINLRGRIICVVELREFFGLSKRIKFEKPKVIITEFDDCIVGFLVRKVSNVRQVSRSDIQPVLMTMAGRKSDYISGITKIDQNVITILNLQRILNVNFGLEL